MSDDRTFERNARGWLELGPADAPGRVVEAALLEIESTSQERDLRIPWRFPTMTTPFRLAAAAVIGVLAIGGGLLLINIGPQSQVGTPSPTPAASTKTSPTPTSSATEPIAEGTYVGPTLQVADIVAAINANPALSATYVINTLFEFKESSSTLQVSLELRDGQWTERQTLDGVTRLGSHGTYSFPDDHTIVLREGVGDTAAVSRFEVNRTADGFTLRSAPTPTDAETAFIFMILFESGPFTPLP